MSPRLHTVFVQVQVHTAKCDLCENHNKRTLYRCTECGQHVCSVCWKKQSGDGLHVFNGGVAGGPDLSADHAVDDDEKGRERDDETQDRTRTRRKARVISDDEDDDVPMLKPAKPNASTNSHKSANRETQRNSRIQSQKSQLDQQRMAQAYDGPERQAAPTRTVFVDGQQTLRQARYRILPHGPHQQATQLPPLHLQPAVYRPRLGVDVDRQAAHNQLVFANNPHTHHQAPRSAPGFISQQHTQTAAQMGHIAAQNQEAFRLNQQQSTYANTEQMDLRNRQVFLHQNTRLVVNGDQVVAQNQRVVDLTGLPPIAVNQAVLMLAARNRQDDLLRQLANSSNPGRAQTSASHENRSPLPARPHPPPAPNSGSHGNTSPFPAQASVSVQHQQHTTPIASRQFPHRVTIQDLLNAPSEGVPIRDRSPETPKSVALPLAYAEVEQMPGVRSGSDQDAKGVSQLLSAADQLNQSGSASSEPRSSSRTVVAESEAAGTNTICPRGAALSPTPRSTADVDLANARTDKHWAPLDRLRLSSSTPDTVSDPAGRPRGHSVYGHASLQPVPRSARANSSAAQSQGSAPRGAQSHQSPRLPISDHAATYLEQWNSGRAALSSSSRDRATDVPPTQLRSPIPALQQRSNTEVQDAIAVGTTDKEAADASNSAPSSPMSVTEDLVGVDVVMIDPDVEYTEHEATRRHKEHTVNNDPWTKGVVKGAEKARARAAEPISGPHSNGRVEKHQRGEKKGGHKTSKEQKASDDIDVVGARGRNGKEVHSDQVDDDGSDIEITSWQDLQSNQTTGNHRGTKAGAKGPETLKKGVAQVKKPERKGQKGKMTGT